MRLYRERPGVDLIELLDRVLDKGAVIDKSDLLRLSKESLWDMKAHIVPHSTNTSAMKPNKQSRLKPVPYRVK